MRFTCQAALPSTEPAALGHTNLQLSPEKGWCSLWTGWVQAVPPRPHTLML